MIAKVPASPLRRRRSGGNALIESAFTLIPTFALIFAFIDFGLMLYRWSSYQNAVREGVRYAITFQTQTSPALGQIASIKNVVQRNSMGLVHASDSPATIFVKFYATTAPDVVIASGGNVPGNIVEVSIQNITLSRLLPVMFSGSYSSSVGPFYQNSSPINLKVYALDILGGYPVGVSSVAP
jgi:Flp pilus assembly protein TadG